MIKKEEIVNAKSQQWLDKSETKASFKKYTDEGDVFEGNMKTDLANINSSAYLGLNAKLTALGESISNKTILSQVYFCIKPACAKKGEYFIADFVAVERKIGTNGTPYLDVIIIDTKRSAATNYTKNQTAAKALGGYKIKSEGTLIKGTKPASFIVGAETIKNGNFLKMYSNGTGAYSGIL